jgi:hypothetical protein
LAKQAQQIKETLQQLTAVVAERDALQETMARMQYTQQHCDALQNQVKQYRLELDKVNSSAESLQQQLTRQRLQMEQEVRSLTTQLNDAQSSVQKWVRECVRHKQEAVSQAKATAAAEQSLSAALLQVEEADAITVGLHKTLHGLYTSLAYRAAQRRRSAIPSREDRISDVRDRAGFALLSTILVFDKRDAVRSMAVAEAMVQQEYAATQAVRQAQDAAVAAAFSSALAEHEANQAAAVAFALAIALTEHEASLAAAVNTAVTAAKISAAERDHAVEAARQQVAAELQLASTAAATDGISDEESGVCRICYTRPSDVVYIDCGHICCCA